MNLFRKHHPGRKPIAVGATIAIASALILSAGAVSATAAPDDSLTPPATPGEIVSVIPQSDGTVLTAVQEVSEPTEGTHTASGEESFDQVTETTIYVDPVAESPKPSALSGTRGGGIVTASRIVPTNDQSSGANDSTASVNVWVSLNYTVVQPSVLRANNWKSKYTRLDPNAVLVSGGVTHRNDRVPASGTQNYSSPSSGVVYTFTPSYAGFNTTSSNLNGIFGQAFLNWRIFGTNYTTYSGNVHPF